MSDETQDVEPKSTEEIVQDLNQHMAELINKILKLETKQ
jgi:hypothetical protein